MKITDMEVELIDHMGTDLSVVNAARVSFHKKSSWDVVDIIDPDVPDAFVGYEKRLKEGDVKLINYLAKHKHFSPFNHCFMTFRVKAPIFVARQLVKHRFMPWNEVSRRYVDDEPEFFMPEKWRGKAVNVKQGSGEEAIDLDYRHPGWYTPEELCEEALSTYQQMMNVGVAPEMARMVLPQNMHTEWFWSGTLGAFADMLRLRLDPHAQYESRQVAEMIYKEVEKIFPVSIKALLENK